MFYTVFFNVLLICFVLFFCFLFVLQSVMVFTKFGTKCLVDRAKCRTMDGKCMMMEVNCMIMGAKCRMNRKSVHQSE